MISDNPAAARIEIVRSIQVFTINQISRRHHHSAVVGSFLNSKHALFAGTQRATERFSGK